VNRFVANDGEFMNTRGDKNEYRIVLARLVHSEPMKLSLCLNERITVQLAALYQNANFTGRLGFGFPNRLNNPVVFELAEKFPCSHLITSSILRRLHQNCHRRRRTR